MNKLPQVKKENRILIICEGFEEYDYLNKLKSLNIWNTSFSIEIKNAKSIDNISKLYSYHFQSGVYYFIVVFCDTETEPYTQFKVVAKSINNVHGKDIAKHIVFFANPCTMQIILSHFKKISLSSNCKKSNADLIQKLTNIKEYTANESQRKILCSKINCENYSMMKNNIAQLSQEYEIIPSSNAIILFNFLEGNNKKWQKKIIDKINN